MMTMGVLAVSLPPISEYDFELNIDFQPYRSRGLGAQSMQQIISAAASYSKQNISSVYLHVQISNDAAKKFYERHGFKEVGIQQGYYTKIVPHDAWILERVIKNSDREAKQK